MGILLTQKEFEKAEKKEKWKGDCEPIMKAQALKVLDELEKPCPHINIVYGFKKRDCPECMAEIRKGLEVGK